MQWAISASLDNTIIVWDLESGSILASFNADEAPAAWPWLLMG